LRSGTQGRTCTNLVSLVGSSGSNLALLARGELGEVAVVVTLPRMETPVSKPRWSVGVAGPARHAAWDVHLVVEDLGLAGLGLRDQGVVQDIEDILADLLELGLDLLAVVADGGDVLVGALGLLLLLNGRDDAPGSTSGADHVLVGHGQEVSLVNGELAAQLDRG
jgi:hypothetical protein